MQRRPARMV